jgi:hypothetical protein
MKKANYKLYKALCTTLPPLIDYASHNPIEAKKMIAGNLVESVTKVLNSSTYSTQKNLMTLVICSDLSRACR